MAYTRLNGSTTYITSGASGNNVGTITPFICYEKSAESDTSITYNVYAGVKCVYTGKYTSISIKVGGSGYSQISDKKVNFTNSTKTITVTKTAKDTTVCSTITVTRNKEDSPIYLSGTFNFSNGSSSYLFGGGVGFSNITVPARPLKTITFNRSSGTGGPLNSYQVRAGRSFTIPSSKPAKSGYTFLGYTNVASNVQTGSYSATYAPGKSITVSSNITLYAVWELTYSSPVISNINLERCRSDGTIDEEGTYVSASFDVKVFYSGDVIYYGLDPDIDANTPYENNSIKTCAVTIGSANYTELSHQSQGEGNYHISGILGNGQLDPDLEYDVTIEVSDTQTKYPAKNTTTKYDKIKLSKFPLDFNADATALGIFRAAPDNTEGIFTGTNLTVGGDLYIDDNLSVVGHYTSAITACGATGTADLVLGTSEKKVKLDSNRARVGVDLTNSNGGVKCAKSGYVEVSGAIYFVSGFNANDLVHLVIKKNSTNIVNAVHRLPGDYDYYSIAPIVYSVSEGDTLYLYAYNQTAARGQINAATFSWLTVKYL